jgi:hypothetical protein
VIMSRLPTSLLGLMMVVSASTVAPTARGKATAQTITNPQTNSQTKTAPPQTKTAAPSQAKTAAPTQTKAATPASKTATPAQTKAATPAQTKTGTPSQTKAASPPQTKAAAAAPQTKAAAPPPQTKAAAPPPQTKAAVPPPQTKAAVPPPQTKAAPPPAQTKAAPPPTPTKAAPPPAKPPAAPPGKTASGAAPAGAKGTASPAGGTTAAPVDTSPPVIIMRETFTYEGSARRDPFLSLVSTAELRPALSDLKLNFITYAEQGGSVANIRDNYARKPVLAKVGTQFGRMRVVAIHPNAVVFSIEEFGTTRRDSLVQKPDTTK